MRLTVTVEETRCKDIEVEASDWEEAFVKVGRDYLDGNIDMRTPDVRRMASIGSDEHDFFDTYNW